MNNSLAIHQSKLASGSVSDVAKKNNMSLAHAFLNVKIIILCDRSGSMTDRDGAFGKARYQVEDELVAKIQAENPGQVLLVSFESSAQIQPNGFLPSPEGGTSYLKAFETIQGLVVGDVRVVLISDGKPHETENQILAYVRQHLIGKLDCMFAGPENSAGYKLLRRIADAANGKCDFDVLNRNLPKLEANLRLALQSGK